MASNRRQLEYKDELAPATPANQVATSSSLLGLSTEVLIEILAYLPAADMTTVQRTCRTIRDIVVGTAYLQYILLANMNRVGDLLPSDFPYSERLELLRCHEQSLRDLQFNLFAECVSISRVPNLDFFSLQGGYLIYQCIPGLRRGLQYGYMDLCSAEELRWVYLTLGERQYPNSTKIVIAVDHDLVMAVRNEQDPNFAALVQLEFFEFSTGAPHPLATTHIVSLPPTSELPEAGVNAEVLGDHILVTIWNRSCKAVVFLVSWKTGTVTLLRMFPARSTTLDRGRPLAVSINSNLVSLVDDCENKLEMCKLELDPVPRLQTLCFLELPQLAPGSSNLFFQAIKEWVPTSKSYARSRSSRGHHLPFYSSAIGTIALHFLYHLPSKFHLVNSYGLIINVPALVSVLPTDGRNVPWEDWGPSSTHVFKLGQTGLTSIGPFWSSDCHTTIVRQYDLLRTRCTKLMAGTKSSLSSRPPFNPMKELPYHIETHLPYHNVVMKNVDLYQFDYIVADREWVVVFGVSVLGTKQSTPYVTVYHVGESLA